MENNNNNNNIIDTIENNKSKKIIKRNETNSPEYRRQSIPIISNNKLFKNQIKSRPLVNSIILKPNNKLKKQLLNLDNDDQYNSVVDLNIKKQKSILYTQLLLKHKIKENLTQINNNKSYKSVTKLNNSKISEKEKIDNNKKNKKRKKNILNNNKELKRKIYKTKGVYDSLEDSELSDSIDKQNYFISPDTKFILIFDFAIILCLILYIIYIPLKLTYYKYSIIYIIIYMIKFIAIQLIYYL
jgi:hypothetical protein